MSTDSNEIAPTECYSPKYYTDCDLLVDGKCTATEEKKAECKIFHVNHQEMLKKCRKVLP